jgi:cephalosporin hydroxylase
MSKDREFLGLSNIWIRECIRYNYAQNFSWLGRPIIQVPQDIYALQEIIWQIKPDLIIETGIAHGGSLIMSASMLALMDYCDAIENHSVIDPQKSKRRVLGIDIDIRSHNRAAIEAHPMNHLIEMIQGSSIDSEVVEKVKSVAKRYERILICLDSNHTHGHVLAELEAYAPLTSDGSYCIVWDTGVEDLPVGFCKDRPWDKGDNPKTAVWEYLRRLEEEGRLAADGTPLKFEIDHVIENKLMITASPDGFLRRTSV